MKNSGIFFLLKKHQETLGKFEISPKQTTIKIGRAGFGADIEIPSPNVSRQHATIFSASPGHLRIRDDNSTNGTYLNGVRITESNLKTGDAISFQNNAAEYILIVNAENQSFRNGHETGHIPLEHLVEIPKSLYELLQEKESVVIGRQDCDITLSNLTISRKHTEVSRQEDGKYLVKDLGSKNGTFVNGEQIHAPTLVNTWDVIQIGQYEFKLEANTSTHIPTDQPEEIILAHGLTRQIGSGEQKKNILNNIRFKVLRGEFVAVMGPSGSGKSTLLKALNGSMPATKGKVYIHGKDFYHNYKLLKQVIGYVPQDDIVHRQLSIYRSLYYAARLRLASDVSHQEIDQKIDEILHKLGILHIKHALIKNISGGQRKRVSIAVELLSDPTILFLDEPTSPLDPETVEEFLKILRRLAESGTTILMVTHKPDDLDSVDKVLFLSKGGYLTFYGPTGEYLDYFQAQNVIGVYASINDVEKGKIWAHQFNQNQGDLRQTPNTNEQILQPDKQSPFRQFYWLSRRYLEIKTNDQVNTLILILQAPIIAVLLVLLFEELMLQTLFLMVIAAIWLGTSNAAREIVSEVPIYWRERMFNLRIIPYILSKIFVINLFSFIQILSMVGIIRVFVGLPHYWENVGLLLLLSFIGALLGLVLSSLADNADKVMSIVPLVLLPQIMLAGVIQRINEENEWLSYLTVSRWGIEAAANIEETVYFYYPNPVPNPDYWEAFQDLNPVDSAGRKALEDSLARQAVSDSLHLYHREKILDNPNMIEYPHYYNFSEILLILALHASLLFVAIFFSLRWKDRL